MSYAGRVIFVFVQSKTKQTCEHGPRRRLGPPKTSDTTVNLSLMLQMQFSVKWADVAILDKSMFAESSQSPKQTYLGRSPLSF